MLVDKMVLANINRFSLIHGWRYFNVYGDGEGHKSDQSSPVTKFAKQAREDGLIKIFEGSGEIYRDFVAVDDVVAVLIDSMDKRLRSGIRDLGTGAAVSFETVAHLVKHRYGGEIETVPFPEHLRSGYQYLTRAQVSTDHKFTTIGDWLSKS
jgi:ADP-L-glycero-D-manno-heptose 6-epimerase